MRTQFSRTALTAVLVLAITLTFSCSGGDDGTESNGGSSSPSSSPSGGSSGGSSSPSGGGGSNKCNSIANCKTKQIGNQTWLAENLNIDVPGSVCYDKKTANCDKYGRLYDWATAMNLDASCNSTSCASQITTPHQGICPSFPPFRVASAIPMDFSSMSATTATGGVPLSTLATSPTTGV